MKVFLVHDDDGNDFVVEAPDFGACMALAKQHLIDLFGPDGGYEDWQPITIQMISDEPVVRP